MDAEMQLQVFNHRWLCNRFLKKTFWHTTWSFLKWKLLKLYYYVKWQVILSWKYYSIKFSEVEKDLRSVYSYLISISNVGWNWINSMSACWQNNRIGDSVLHYSNADPLGPEFMTQSSTCMQTCDWRVHVLTFDEQTYQCFSSQGDFYLLFYVDLECSRFFIDTGLRYSLN